MTVDKLKLYARVDTDEDDALLLDMLNAAEQTVQDMTGKNRPTDNDEIYDICVMQLTAHWYENRTPTEYGTAVHDVPYTMQLLINHITMSGRYPEVQHGVDEQT